MVDNLGMSTTSDPIAKQAFLLTLRVQEFYHRGATDAAIWLFFRTKRQKRRAAAEYSHAYVASQIDRDDFRELRASTLGFAREIRKYRRPARRRWPFLASA